MTKETAAWVAGGSFLILGFCYAMAYAEMRGIEAQKKHKAEALEYAKQGWVYKCGWDCRWERIPGGPTAGDSARRGRR